MSDWQPVTHPPSEVGRYEINDVFGHTHAVQWDGRHFRYAAGTFAGRVFGHYKGDLWKSNETKESEMLNSHDIEDMRPEPAAVPIGWYEAEPRCRGADLRELLAWPGQMTHSGQWHWQAERPETSNPVWPVYAATQEPR